MSKRGREPGNCRSDNPLLDVATRTLARELQRRSFNDKTITCAKSNDVYVITVDVREVEFLE